MAALIERNNQYNTEVQSQRPNSLQEEMVYLRHNFQKEGLQHDWRYLDGIGFHTRTHVDMLYANIDGIISPSLKEEKVKEWLEQTEQDIKGFNLEYLAQGLTFPIYYQQEIVDGYQRIVAPLYGNKPMVDLTSEKERNGVVKESLAKQVEPYLLHAEDGSIAVMTSPAGWSGLVMENGEEIIYPDSQTYIWQKQGSEIVGFTIRTDFSLAEHKAFIKGQFGIELAPDATVTDYVAAVGFLNANENPGIDIKDVVDTMRDTRFDLSGGSVQAYKDRLWNEVYRDLENRDALWQFDSATEKLVAEFVAFIDSGSWTRREVEEALAITILRIARHIRGDIITKKQQDTYMGSRGHMVDVPTYGVVLKDVRSLEGCAGGGIDTSPFRNEMRELMRQGQVSRMLVQSVTPRYAEIPNIADDGLGPREVACPEPNCGKTNKRPFGGYVTACKHCNSEKIACK